MDPCCAQPGGAQHGRLGGIWCVVKTREPGGGSVREEVSQGWGGPASRKGVACVAFPRPHSLTHFTACLAAGCR
eukprot:scaffold38090_cov41-Phaeocystis_antarctica.AAC.2